MRRAAAKPRDDETALVVKGDDEENVENELELCFREAVHALSAIEDQPIVENAINGSESGDWKRAINEELMQIEKLGTWELIEAQTMPTSSPAAGYFTVNAMHKAKYPVTRHDSLPRVFNNSLVLTTQTRLHPLSDLKHFEFYLR